MLGETVLLSEVNDESDKDINQNQHFFNFVDVPSFASLFTSNPAEPLYFVKVTEKGNAIKDMKAQYGHFIHTGELLWIMTCILSPPDDIYDTYVEIDNDLLLNLNICNALVAKAHILFDIGDILRSSFIS